MIKFNTRGRSPEKRPSMSHITQSELHEEVSAHVGNLKNVAKEISKALERAVASPLVPIDIRMDVAFARAQIAMAADALQELPAE